MVEHRSNVWPATFFETKPIVLVTQLASTTLVLDQLFTGRNEQHVLELFHQKFLFVIKFLWIYPSNNLTVIISNLLYNQFSSFTVTGIYELIFQQKNVFLVILIVSRTNHEELLQQPNSCFC